LGLRAAQTTTGGSSEEFSAMDASLTEQRRVQEDGLRVVNCFTGGRVWTVPQQPAPANYVPAAAVRRRGRALSGVTGRKGSVGGRPHLERQPSASLREASSDGSTVSGREGGRIPGGVVKCVEIRRNTEGEGRLLAAS